VILQEYERGWEAFEQGLPRIQDGHSSEHGDVKMGQSNEGLDAQDVAEIEVDQGGLPMFEQAQVEVVQEKGGIEEMVQGGHSGKQPLEMGHSTFSEEERKVGSVDDMTALDSMTAAGGATEADTSTKDNDDLASVLYKRLEAGLPLNMPADQVDEPEVNC